MSTPDVLCLGNLCVDESVHLNGRRTVAAGGDAVYAALGALLADARAAVCAPVGHDVEPTMLARLGAAGIGPGGFPRRSLPTLRHTITHRPDGGRDWASSASPEAFDLLSPAPDDLGPADLAADAVVLTAMGLRAQLTLSRWLPTATAAPVYLDLREDYLDARHELLEMVRGARVFLPSELEAAALAGTSDVAAASETLAACGPAVVVVKRGEAGCHVYAGGRHTDLAAAPARVVDTTGAGDAFCGAFAAAHIRDGDALRAARVASRVAAVAVSGLGTSALLAAATARAVVSA